MTDVIRQKRLHKLFLLILGFAITLRLIGITHGFPYIYHPDEPAVVRAALALRFDPNPHHFDWPHLYIYLNYFGYMVFAKLRDLTTIVGLKSQIAQIAPLVYNDKLIFYLLSRVFSALIGAFTVVPIYLWVKKLIDRNSALGASALLAVAPFHVRTSHYALIDVPMVFFLSWSLYFSTFSPSLAGLFLGFSTSIKYNGILGGLFVALYLLLQRSASFKQRLINIVKLGFFTIVGFIVGTPFAVLDFKTFIRTDGPQGALWQFTNVGKVTFGQQIAQFVEVLAIKLPENIGCGAFVVLILGLAIIMQKVVKKKHEEPAKVVLLALAVFFGLTFYISGSLKYPSHYYLVTYPFFLAVAGWSLAYLAGKIRRSAGKLVLIFAILMPSLIGAIQNIIDLQTKTAPKIYGGDVLTKNR